MLTITVGAVEVYDESTDKFGTQGGVTLHLEHSLVSLSKWESEFEKPFLVPESKSPEEILAYIRCMLVEPNTPGDILHQLSETNVEAINAYIDAKMTATWFNEPPGAPVPQARETVTSELIYYWMTAFGIPFQCETWHLNRLFTLIRVCNIKQAAQQKKKPGRNEHATRQKLNAQRKAEMGTTG